MSHVLGTKSNPYIKDPDDTLDFVINWNGGAKPFLGTDTISAAAGGSTWIVTPGITNVLDTKTTTTTTIWLSGGTEGVRYAILNRITTAGGRTKDKTIYLVIKQQ